MQNYWNEAEAAEIRSDLDMRVYTSRLLGKDMNLVMHGGGNTSVKSQVNGEDILYVKGSGWDLETIEPAGFAPVKLGALLKMAELDSMSDMDMVAQQREAMIDASAPNPSVEAILHAVIPFKFVDHTHADALVTISNTPNGEAILKELYGDTVLFVPYVMPGFILAKAVYEQTKNVDWSNIKGMVLMNHGLFTFSDSGKEAYDRMIELAGKAEDYLQSKTHLPALQGAHEISEDYLEELVGCVAQIKSPDAPEDVIGLVSESMVSQIFAQQSDSVLKQVSVLTPDHIIRTKQKPVILSGDIESIEDEVQAYIASYKAYFNQHQTHEICLNPAPHYAVIKGVGSVAFGKSEKEVEIIQDINDHTFEAILRAQDLGGYQPLSDAELFEMEYWELEQAKLKKSK
ncbi:class II aldolase/adducin family protein [Hydrogenovibrio sp. JE_KL2]|uniref:class II aldolase/adducin family protein n=1 Tax=Hydrogenovibrio sp. JE_KL2 TaxID=2651188 RepID=UPI00128BEC77|nr:class II aldolase/adducin family protein [Hydrogenovibrio sp. JE_KL2]MPQ76657.1 oxidoreductase [Hydrogenovibrio sp. JE_KL2]